MMNAIRGVAAFLFDLALFVFNRRLWRALWSDVADHDRHCDCSDCRELVDDGSGV